MELISVDIASGWFYLETPVFAFQLQVLPVVLVGIVVIALRARKVRMDRTRWRAKR